MGGRLDATNATDPLASAIVSSTATTRPTWARTLAAIAREKAGVLRAGRVTVLGRCLSRRAVRSPRRARAGRAPGGRPRRRAALERDGRLDVDDPARAATAASGRCRARTSATTSWWRCACSRQARAAGFAVDLAAARRGLSGVRWPGRLQRLPGRPAAAARRRPQPRRGAGAGRVPARPRPFRAAVRRDARQGRARPGAGPVPARARGRADAVRAMARGRPRRDRRARRAPRARRPRGACGCEGPRPRPAARARAGPWDWSSWRAASTSWATCCRSSDPPADSAGAAAGASRSGRTRRFASGPDPRDPDVPRTMPALSIRYGSGSWSSDKRLLRSRPARILQHRKVSPSFVTKRRRLASVVVHGDPDDQPVAGRATMQPLERPHLLHAGRAGRPEDHEQHRGARGTTERVGAEPPIDQRQSGAGWPALIRELEGADHQYSARWP